MYFCRQLKTLLAVYFDQSLGAAQSETLVKIWFLNILVLKADKKKKHEICCKIEKKTSVLVQTTRRWSKVLFPEKNC